MLLTFPPRTFPYQGARGCCVGRWLSSFTYRTPAPGYMQVILSGTHSNIKNNWDIMQKLMKICIWLSDFSYWICRTIKAYACWYGHSIRIFNRIPYLNSVGILHSWLVDTTISYIGPDCSTISFSTVSYNTSLLFALSCITTVYKFAVYEFYINYYPPL